MNILHYTLSLPPHHHSGGLTRYFSNLLLAENGIIDSVTLLYPIKINLFSQKNENYTKHHLNYHL